MPPDSRQTLPEPSPRLLQGASLFLDFDGTLVDIVARPDAVEVSETLRALMSRLWESLDGRLAIVSGRPAHQVRQLFGDPEFAIGGSHGLEMHWPGGRIRSPARPEGLDEALAELHRLKERHPALLVEEKPFGAALHYRLAPEAEDDCRTLAVRISQSTGLPLQPGKMVFELTAAGADKGSAVRAFMTEPEMNSGRPVFVGDDVTDEAGFAAAAALGGAGVLVGPMRETAAAYRLHDVGATLLWLEAACEVMT
ncbi:MAG: trehalose-phosphatase [Alphaproteobacteria bacterium]|nr:trehalose-phosphatase [Alphaproteobacteria bacterium]